MTGAGSGQAVDFVESPLVSGWQSDRLQLQDRGRQTVFQICVINAALNPDGTLPVPTQLTNDTFGDLTATFSPDGQYILFHRRVGPPGSQQLFIMNASLNADGTLPQQTQLTFGTPTSPDGVNNLAHWGELRLMGPNAVP